ncbi:MAG: 4-hydroxy-3-methylbut-2-enyl diphosphate reductase [Bacteroidales bacterium]|nr:4-hydroxy-3-methylbut-2-enyl diphosphate reductase [Bacteroidales bacterium]
MNLSVEIDKYSGFCNGVVRAVKHAEEYLQKNRHLYSLGAIVHNSSEIERLSDIGLQIIDIDKMRQLNNEVVLVRAHGEPPATYSLAKERQIELIDCTCPVVLNLQRKIAETYRRIAPNGGQVVIFGKKGHAEVNGLVGQTDSQAIVVESESDLELIDYNREISLFSQTTKDPAAFKDIAEAIECRRNCQNRPLPPFQVHNTICSQVSNRHKRLQNFATEHDVIIFVSGKESSNGKVLYNLCHSINSRTYRVENGSMIEKGWFQENDRVGICGATSTPRWQLEEIYYICKNLI